MPREEARARVIEDASTGTNLVINSNGSINVTNVEVAAPVGATDVVVTGFGSVASTSGIDTYYVIPNGTTLSIQLLQAGAESSTGGSAVDLFHDPNGNLSSLTRILTLYVTGESTRATVDEQFVGNGTARMVLRRRGFSGSAREMFARFKGFTE